jgi:hypothetical protein
MQHLERDLTLRREKLSFTIDVTVHNYLVDKSAGRSMSRVYEDYLLRAINWELANDNA